ncbi:hypothetical protein WA158_006282 [Blastocystis sp. Blastoise]
MSAPCDRRIKADYLLLQKKPLEYATVTLEDNLRVWTVSIMGPIDSPYEGGTFQVQLTFPDNYPHRAPEIKFITKIYHPLIDHKTNDFCPEEIVSAWKPIFHADFVISTIYKMLENPSIYQQKGHDDDIMFQIRESYEKFVETAKQWTENEAM